MSKIIFYFKNIAFISFVIFFISGCMISPTPSKKSISGKFSENYQGIRPNNSTVSAIIPCLNSEVIQLKINNFDYNEIVDSEYRLGNIEVGHSTFESEPFYAQNEIEYFSRDIGACKTYWITHELIDPTTNTRHSKDYYGASYFSQVDKDAIIGFHAGEPSDAIKREMDRYYGVEVRAIMPGTIAETMGLKEKDIILFINSQRCTYEEYIRDNCGVIGKWSVVRIYRDKKILEIKN